MPTLNYAKETTTTTGTGTYSLAGAVSPFASFVARATDDVGGSSPWSNINYVCVDNAGEFEYGSGTLTDAGTDTLTRSTVFTSSNGGAAVNWGAGTKDIYSWPPASELTGVVKQVVVANDGTDRSLTTTIPSDATVPTSSEGTQIVSASITPTDSAHIIKVTVSVPVCEAISTGAVVAAFTGTTCIGAGQLRVNTESFHGEWYYTAGGTTAQTVSVRAGDTGAGTFYINRTSSTANLFGTAAVVTLIIEEIEV